MINIDDIKIVSLSHNKDLCKVDTFGVDNARKVNRFHASFPEYKKTPLVSLNALSKQLGIKGLFVKDESYRFGLNAFKVLGGSYAIGNIIAHRLNMDISDLPYEKMVSEDIRKELGEVTFVTATDGNHGRGVAWTANRLKQKSVVYMPKGSALERLNNIKALGSDASITEMNYDDAVRLAKENADKYGWTVVQDTSWPGYNDIPTWIMQGYTTMALEASEQLNGIKPTHVFLQAGVGALAGAVTAFFADLYKEEKPIITIVEPNKADCIFKTVSANDGQLHFVKGDMDSIMAGLCCGEPCSIGYNILKDYGDHFISLPDSVTEKGMRVLYKNNVISGESGAVTTGLVVELLQNEELSYMKKQLKIDNDSVILCFSTEGDTDKANYQKIINGVD